jgi:site-specific DNA recombinase
MAEAGGMPISSWAAAVVPRPRRAPAPTGIRFAFYGRMSTVEFQHRETSQQWQRMLARDVVAGRGQIVVEFFDEGCSRRRGWADRPGAAALLAEVADGSWRFDAVVVGEYERAFYGDQLRRLMPILDRHGVGLWLPELGGPVDLADPAHGALLLLLGSQAKREVLRARHRVMAAMRVQTIEQGRYLGGRPPYGYRLADGGPHPNTAHAAWGRRLRRLEPDPATAPNVQWIFGRRLAGFSVASIARTLNECGVACPSAADPARNRHRHSRGWTVRSVAAILASPRYTGYQVWNRQRTDRDQAEASSLNAELASVHRWNSSGAWAISRQPAHQALISDSDFIAAQTVRVDPQADTDEDRHYLLVGLTAAGTVAGRWTRTGHIGHRPPLSTRPTSATQSESRPHNSYVREATALTFASAQLGESTEAAGILNALRSRGLVIECGSNGLRLTRRPTMTCPHRG